MKATKRKVQDASDLISLYNRKHPNGHFFDYETLTFFGERRSEMRLLKNTVTVESYSGVHECYVLSSRQRKHPLGPRTVYHYFDVETFDDIQPK